MFMGFGLLVLFVLGGLLFGFLGEGRTLTSDGKSALTFQKKEKRSTASEILDERLARGEISEEEYDKIRTRIQ
ncbi:MAG: SHOCT domain-containing protein [Anaerolineae bacterium]